VLTISKPGSSACSATLSLPVAPPQLTVPTVTLSSISGSGSSSTASQTSSSTDSSSSACSATLSLPVAPPQLTAPTVTLTLVVGSSNSSTASQTSSSTDSTSQPTPTGLVVIDIYTDSDCENLLETTQLNTTGQCYSPTDSSGNPIGFKCFEVTSVIFSAHVVVLYLISGHISNHGHTRRTSSPSAYLV
jgi:hypothetical protein